MEGMNSSPHQINPSALLGVGGGVEWSGKDCGSRLGGRVGRIDDSVGRVMPAIAMSLATRERKEHKAEPDAVIEHGFDEVK